MDSGPFSLTGLRPSQTPPHPSTRSLFRAFFLGPVNPNLSTRPSHLRLLTARQPSPTALLSLGAARRGQPFHPLPPTRKAGSLRSRPAAPPSPRISDGPGTLGAHQQARCFCRALEAQGRHRQQRARNGVFPSQKRNAVGRAWKRGPSHLAGLRCSNRPGSEECGGPGQGGAESPWQS